MCSVFDCYPGQYTVRSITINISERFDYMQEEGQYTVRSTTINITVNTLNHVHTGQYTVQSTTINIVTVIFWSVE